MSPKIVLAKTAILQQVLLDLKKHIGKPNQDKMLHHYEIERQVQLAVDLAISISRRVLVIKGIPVPDTSRQVFEILSKKKIIPKPMATSLEKTVGLRNILVHEYEDINYDLFFDGLEEGYKVFLKFIEKIIHIKF